MVNRLDKRAKVTRWCVYFAKKPQVRTWKRTLREVVEAGRAQVTFRDVSQYRVELVWSKAGTYDSAARLVRLAREKMPLGKSVGSPQGLRMTWTLPRTKLRQLRPQGLRMTRVGPQSKLRLLLQMKLRLQRRRGDAS